MKKPEDTNSIGNLTIDILKLIGFDDGLMAKAVEGSLQTLKVADAQLAKLKTYQTVVRDLSANPSEHHKLERIVLKVDTDRFLFPIVKQLKFDDIEKDTDSTKLARIYLEKNRFLRPNQPMPDY